MQGKLYLIPNHLGDENISKTIPAEVAATAINLRFFIVENIRTARRFLKLLDKNMDIDGSTFFVLDKHTARSQHASFIQPIKEGHDIGIISEAGCPGVADPGAEIVNLAHQQNITIVPLTGPSSILLALMASGLNGQNFAFHGYLPIDKSARAKKIKQLETQSKKENQTQLFIEAPYRNMAMAEDLLKNCQPDTLLCIASNLTLADEFVKTRPISAWKNKIPDLHKKPVMFLFLAQ